MLCCYAFTEAIWANSQTSAGAHVLASQTVSYAQSCPQSPEGVGAEGCLVVAGDGADPLVSRHHVLQGALLDDVEAHAQAGPALHVIDMLRLQDGVHGQTLEV